MLDRKLLRDLWEMKGQSVAIASVIAAGVTMFVMYLSNFDSLQRTRAAYYESARFADVFASLKRAPSQPRNAAWPPSPASQTVSTRVVADVTLDVPGMAEPATGRLISLPERGRPPLNDVYLRRGRWVDPARPDEVLASEMFCEAHGLRPGDRVGRDHQRAQAVADHRRHRAVAGVRLRDSARRNVSRQAAVRNLLDGPPRAGVGLQHGGRVQRRLARARRAASRRPRSSPTSIGCSALRRPRRGAAITAAVGLDARERAVAAADVRLLRAADLLRRRRVHPERRARRARWRCSARRSRR